MSQIKRPSLEAIQTNVVGATPEEIELREVNQPLLDGNEENSNNVRVNTSDEPFDTPPFPTSLDLDEEQSQAMLRPATDNDSELRQRRQERRSSSIHRASPPRNRGFQHTVRAFWADLLPADNRRAWRLPITVFSIAIGLAVVSILFVVLGYSSVDYDEFGVTHNLATGVLNLKHPYSSGIHIILPWETMLKFDKTARYLDFDDLAVFTTDQASVLLDATVVYRIRPDQIEPIWLNFADQHEKILRLVAENILRNYGNRYSIYDYRARREHVEYRLSQILQQTLSGDCCPICCESHSCSKTIEYSCARLAHCNNSMINCSHGYFVDIDAVYIYKVALPKQIIKRLHTLMLKPLFTEIAESQENAAVVRIETERQRNEFLNRARQVLMSALAEAELIREKARALFDRRLLKQIGTSEQRTFSRLNLNKITDQLSISFLMELHQLANLSQTVDVNTFVAHEEQTNKTSNPNDVFDFVQASDVFDLTEFLAILEN